MLVVDAYNVLETEGVLPSHLAGPEVHDLIEMIAGSRFRRHRTIIVCDGVPRHDRWEHKPHRTSNERTESDHGGGHAAFDVVYAGPGREADEAIEALLVSHSAARRMIIVSTDRRIRKAATRSGATSIISSVFLTQLAEDLQGLGVGERSLPKRPKFATEVPLSRLDVAFWLAHMQADPELAGGPLTVEERPSKLMSQNKAVVSTSKAIKVNPAGSLKRDTLHSVNPEKPVAAPKANALVVNSIEDSASVTPRPAWMHEAARHWAGRLNLEELDTSQWLSSPIAPDPTLAKEPQGVPRSLSEPAKKRITQASHATKKVSKRAHKGGL